MTTTQIALGLIRTSKGNPRKHVEALAGLHEQGGEGHLAPSIRSLLT